MLPQSSAISVPLAVVVEVLDSSVLLVLRQVKSVASSASEFTFESPTATRTPTAKVSIDIKYLQWGCYMGLRKAYN